MSSFFSIGKKNINIYLTKTFKLEKEMWEPVKVKERTNKSSRMLPIYQQLIKRSR
ncbi:hypothetical protein LguiA_017323 [Lonicera macranthoides]